MSFEDNIKYISPALKQLKNNTPVLIAGNKVFVNGIGGNFIPGGSTGAEVTLGVINAAGKFQPFSFSGTTPTESGDAITVANYKSWNSTLPSPTPSGATDFYKCVSVDTANNTWTGYKAVLNLGVYSFLSLSTSGLTYSSVTPVANKIYSDGALITVDKLYQGGMPSDLLMYYFPLADAADTGALPAGTTLTLDGAAPSYGLLSFGMKYMYVSDAKTVKYIDIPSANRNPPFSISMWAKGASFTPYCIGYGGYNNYKFVLVKNNNSVRLYGPKSLGYNSEALITYDGSDSINWHNYIVTWDTDNKIKLYIDGTYIGLNKCYLYLGDYYSLHIGYLGTTCYTAYTGYFSSCRAYRKVLTLLLIAILATLFTPTNA